MFVRTTTIEVALSGRMGASQLLITEELVYSTKSMSFALKIFCDTDVVGHGIGRRVERRGVLETVLGVLQIFSSGQPPKQSTCIPVVARLCCTHRRVAHSLFLRIQNTVLLYQ